MGDSTDGNSDIMSLQDVNRKRKDRNESSGRAASGLEAGDMSKTTKAENMRRESEQTEWKVMIVFKREGDIFTH